MRIELDWRGTIEPDHEWMGDLQLAIDRSDTMRQRLRLARIKAKPIAIWMAERLSRWEYDKVVLFFVSRDMGKHLCYYLKPFRAKTIYPGNQDKKAETAINRLQANYKRRVLLCRHDIPLRIKGYETFDCEIPNDGKPRGQHQFIIPSLPVDVRLMQTNQIAA